MTPPPPPLRWGAEALWEQLLPELPGLSVEVVARISSTNTALLERARVATDAREVGELAQVRRSTESQAFGRRAADMQPCLLVAEHQTAGRGRQGRPWQAVAGSSLTFSLALPLCPPDWSGLSLAVGVALADALQPLDSAQPERAPRVMIKWPNDLWLIDANADAKADANVDSGAHANADAGESREVVGRKLGGILIETVSSGSQRLAVIGIGINVLPMAMTTAEASTGFACLHELDAGVSAPQVLARVALPLVVALHQFERSGFADFAERFAARDVLFQRRVTTTQPGLPEGVALGVSDSGALQVLTPAGVHAVSSGEVSVRPGMAGESPPARAPETPC